MINYIKALAIVFAVLFYWKFVYYPYHKKPFTPLSLIFGGGIIGIYGAYCWWFEKTVIFQNVSALYMLSAAFLAVSFIFVFLGAKKHGLRKEIDITLAWTEKTLGKPFVYLMMMVSFPAFIILIMGTYCILGQEHIFFWSMIFIAWAVSNYKLLTRYVI